MKTSAQIRKEIEQKAAQAVAIAELAKSENRELTAEEKKDVDKLIGENGDTHQLQADLNRAIKLEQTMSKLLAGKIDQPLADRQGKPLIGDAMDDGYPIFAMDRVKVPAKAKAAKPKFFDNHEDAYVSGLFLAAIAHKDEFGENVARQKAEDMGFRFLNVLTTTDNESAGVLTPVQFETAVLVIREQYGVFRRNVGVFPMSAAKDYAPRSLTDAEVYFGDEADEDWDDESDPTFDQVSLTAKDWYCMTRMSRNLSEDAYISMADFMAQMFGRSLAKKEDEIGFIGNGSSAYGNMQGFDSALKAGCNVTATGMTTYGALTLPYFHNVLASMKNYSNPMSMKWYVNKACYHAAMERLMAAAGGNTKTDLAGRIGPTFLGYDVEFVNCLPSALTTITEQTFGFFGDAAMAAKLGQRRGMSIEANTNVYWKRNQIALRAWQRADINVHEVGTDTASGPMLKLVMG